MESGNRYKFKRLFRFTTTTEEWTIAKITNSLDSFGSQD